MVWSTDTLKIASKQTTGYYKTPDLKREVKKLKSFLTNDVIFFLFHFFSLYLLFLIIKKCVQKVSYIPKKLILRSFLNLNQTNQKKSLPRQNHETA